MKNYNETQGQMPDHNSSSGSSSGSSENSSEQHAYHVQQAHYPNQQQGQQQFYGHTPPQQMPIQGQPQEQQGQYPQYGQFPQQYGHYPVPMQVPAVETPEEAAKKEKQKKNLRIAALVLSVILFLGVTALVVNNALPERDNAPITATAPANDSSIEGNDEGTTGSTPIEVPTGVANPSEDELSVQVARRVLPSVVSISGSFDMGFGMRTDDSRSAGAGVILSAEGYIVTNHHVIEHLNNITVTAGAQTYPAVLVGEDPSTDLAVLKIDATGDLPAIELGTSSNLLEGQYVMAVGSPFGHENSVSAGIISGLGRNNVVATQAGLTAYVDLIQTDAAINPGNSGGALVDKEGRLIGINSLINTTSGASAGVGFAIPVDTVIHVANQLIESGHASHAFLGVRTQSITPEIARAYGFPVERGAVVNTVAGGSPADAAGISIGDFIVRIGDREITNSEDVFSAIRSNRVGDSVEVEIYRSGENDVLTATLGSDDFRARNQQQQQQMPPQHPPTGP